jgi:hypothetical protein
MVMKGRLVEMIVINGKAIAYGGKQRNMRHEIGNKDTDLLKMTYP